MTLLDAQPLLAILRSRERCPIAEIVDAIRRGGIGLVEVTAETPGALDAVRAAADAGDPIGAGTIVSSTAARTFAQAGASFLVSPGVNEEIVRTAVELGVPAVPGALSPTEIVTAIDAGAEAVKLFPAGLGGPDYLRALRGPFPNVAFVPTGGIRSSDVPAWLDAGATCVGLGATLIGSPPPMADRDLDALTERTRDVVSLARTAAGPSSG
jgi:2-dehydro-3-deoxyphosphogluconate aldolase / (4S)-4-hydroxy-2-oxoglutarate aldolase